MKISIVTPCHNRAAFLNEALASVMAQSGEFSIQYIIQNSGDSSEVREILDKWETRLSSGQFQYRCNHLELQVHHETDSGMYEGLNRGFARADGDVLAWLNSDDLYHPGAFQTVAEVFSRIPDAYWLTGIPNSFNSRGSRTGFDSYPRAYSREFIRRGLYRSENVNFGLNWIAQDGCFWRNSLWSQAGGHLEESLRFSADFDLWQRFSAHADLVKVNTFLGGYRCHGDQFTGDPANYISELPPYEPPPTGWMALHKWLINHPEDQRFFFNPEKGAPWIQGFGLEWDWLVGRTVSFSFDSGLWEICLSPIL